VALSGQSIYLDSTAPHDLDIWHPVGYISEVLALEILGTSGSKDRRDMPAEAGQLLINLGFPLCE
jgi:hypothetical protein